MSSHLRRRGAALPAVARFHGDEARGDSSLCGERARMARRLKVLVGSSCRGVAVLMPVHDSDRNHPMQRTRGHRRAWWRARWSRAFDQGRSEQQAFGRAQPPFGFRMRLLPTLTIASALLCASTGCGVLNLLPGRTIHQKFGWKAEDYFADQKSLRCAGPSRPTISPRWSGS
jgi:hypothetical protein